MRRAAIPPLPRLSSGPRAPLPRPHGCVHESGLRIRSRAVANRALHWVSVRGSILKNSNKSNNFNDIWRRGRDLNSRYGLAKDRYRGQRMGQQDLTIARPTRFHGCTQSKCRLLRLTCSLQLMAFVSFRTELATSH